MSILAYALAHGVAAHAGLFEPRALPIAPLANTSCSTSLDNDLATFFAAPSDRLKAQRDGCAAALALTREEQAAVAAEVKSITVRPSPLRYELPCLQEWDAEPPPPTLHLADTFLASRYGQRRIGRIKPLQAPKRLTEVVQLRHLPVDESAVLAFEQTVPPIDKLLDIELPAMTDEDKAALKAEMQLNRQARQEAATTVDDFDIDEEIPPIAHRLRRPASPPLFPRLWPTSFIKLPSAIEPMAIDEPSKLRLPPDATIRDWEGLSELPNSSGQPSSSLPVRPSSPPSDISLPAPEVQLAPIMPRSGLSTVELIRPPKFAPISSPAELVEPSYQLAPDDPRIEDFNMPSLLLPGQIGRPTLPPPMTFDLGPSLLPQSLADFAPDSSSSFAMPKLTGCKALAIELEWWPLLPLEPVPLEMLVEAELLDRVVDAAAIPPLSPAPSDDGFWLDDEPIVSTTADVIESLEPRQWSSSTKENVAPPIREASTVPSTAVVKLGAPPSIGSGSTASIARGEPGMFIFQDATPLSRHSSRTSEPHTALQEIDIPPPRSVRTQLDAFVTMRAHGRAPDMTPPAIPAPRPPVNRHVTPALSRSSDLSFPARPIVRVLVSVDLLQLPVFRYLGPAGFELVEAPEVDGHVEPHMVIDGVSALIFVQTQYLPRQLDEIIARFAHFVPATFDHLILLVVGSASNPHLATNPAVIKALAQLTALGIEHRVLGSPHEAADVAYAFAERSRSLASSDDWTAWTEPDRSWLGSEIDEDTRSLLAAPGMHNLAAQAMLSRTSLDDLLELDDEGRLAIYSGIIGVGRVQRLSRLIADNAAMTD